MKQMLPGENETPKIALSVKEVRLTMRTIEEGPHEGSPVVAVTISNHLATLECIQGHVGSHLDGQYTIEVIGSGLKTVVPGPIRRLMPGDDARVDVGIEILESSASELSSSKGVHVTIRDASGYLIMKSEKWGIDLSSVHNAYESNHKSLMAHETPRWVRSSLSLASTPLIHQVVAKR
jgi:hypothetical protein